MGVNYFLLSVIMPAKEVEVELDEIPQSQTLQDAPSHRIRSSVNVRNSSTIIIEQQSSDCGSIALGCLGGFLCGPLGCLCGLCSNNKTMYYIGFFLPALIITLLCIVILAWFFLGAAAISSALPNSSSNSPMASISNIPSPSPSILPPSASRSPVMIPPTPAPSCGYTPARPYCISGNSLTLTISGYSESTFGGFFTNQVSTGIQKYYYNATIHSTNSAEYSVGWYEYGCYSETNAGCSNHFDFRYLYELTTHGNDLTHFSSTIQVSPYTFGAIFPVIKCDDFLACHITVDEYVSCSESV